MLLNEQVIRKDINDAKKEYNNKAYEHVGNKLIQSLQSGELTYHDFCGTRGLAELFIVERDTGLPCGREVLNTGDLRLLTENDGSAVNSAMFLKINGQIILNKVLEAQKMMEPGIVDEVGSIPTTQLRGERFGGISNVSFGFDPVPEDTQIKSLGTNQVYVDTPALIKLAKKMGLTYEAVTMDKTGEILYAAQKLGQSLKQSRELEMCSALADTANIYNAGNRTRFRWGDVTYQTYQSAGTYWTNTEANPLIDVTSLNKAYVTMSKIVDSYTGLPIVSPMTPLTVICTPQNAFKFLQIKHQIQFRNFSGTSPDANTYSAILPFEFDVISSKYLSKVLSDASLDQGTWFLTNLKEAFTTIKNLDTQVQEAAVNSGVLFENHLVAMYRVLDYKTAFTLDPKHTYMATVS